MRNVLQEALLGAGPGFAEAAGPVLTPQKIDEMLPPMRFADAKGFLVAEGRDMGAAADGDDGGVECAVCLSAMADDEMVRVLPCVHVFHVGCIDPWFQRRGGSPACPTCKAEVPVPLGS